MQTSLNFQMEERIFYTTFNIQRVLYFNYQALQNSICNEQQHFSTYTFLMIFKLISKPYSHEWVYSNE